MDQVKAWCGAEISSSASAAPATPSQERKRPAPETPETPDNKKVKREPVSSEDEVTPPVTPVKQGEMAKIVIK